MKSLTCLLSCLLVPGVLPYVPYVFIPAPGLAITPFVLFHRFLCDSASVVLFQDTKPHRSPDVILLVSAHPILDSLLHTPLHLSFCQCERSSRLSCSSRKYILIPGDTWILNAGQIESRATISAAIDTIQIISGYLCFAIFSKDSVT